MAVNTDDSGNSSTDTTDNEITVDTVKPDVPTVNTLVTEDRTPVLTGTWDNVKATALEVTVATKSYNLGTNSELTATAGAWQLDLSSEPQLAVSVYDVVAVNTDEANNSATDTTTNELTINQAKTGIIKGIYFEDVNGDGMRNENEPGISGAKVDLMDSADESVVMVSVTTDSSGYYEFPAVEEGSYVLGFEKTTGFNFTVENAGEDDELDSDVNRESGRTAAVIITAAAGEVTLDAGIVSLCGECSDFTLQSPVRFVWNSFLE